MSRLAISLFLSFLYCTCFAQTSSIQSQIASACTTGGTVSLHPSITLASTLILGCPAGKTPVTLQGAPTQITCQTGASPCIIMGNIDPSNFSDHQNLTLRNVYMNGPGISVPGSVGIRLMPSADLANIADSKIAGFDVGIHFLGDVAADGLLNSDTLTNVKVGFIGATVNTAIHLEGPTANIYFNNFYLAAQQRAILSDGPGGSGSGVTFSNGTINTTLTPGVAGVYVAASDQSIRGITLNQIQDWEATCPLLQIGDHGNVFISGTQWVGDPWGGAGTAPAIDILPNTISWLRLDQADLPYCKGNMNGEIIRVESATAQVRATNSSFYLGTVNFTAPALATFAGNVCATNSGPTLIGNLTRVRASANAGTCMPDR